MALYTDPDERHGDPRSPVPLLDDPHVFVNGPQVGQKISPRVGEDDASIRPVKQVLADDPLDSAELATERWLRDAEPPRRSKEATLLRDSEQHPHMPYIQFQCHNSPIARTVESGKSHLQPDFTLLAQRWPGPYAAHRRRSASGIPSLSFEVESGSSSSCVKPRNLGVVLGSRARSTIAREGFSTVVKRSFAVFAVLCACLMGTVAVSTPAGAAPAAGAEASGAQAAIDAVALASCPANRVCIYANKDFGRQFGVAFPPNGGNSNLHNYSCIGCVSAHHPASNNTGGDQMTSYINNTAVNFCGYYNPGYGGYLITMRPFSSSRGVGGPYNDEMSSIKAC